MVAYNWAFVVAAYAITWTVILGYAFHLSRTLRRARREYELATSRAGGGQ